MKILNRNQDKIQDNKEKEKKNMSIDNLVGNIKSTAKVISLELAVVLVLTTVLGTNDILTGVQVQFVSTILMYVMVVDTIVRLVNKRVNEIKKSRAEVNYKISINDYSEEKSIGSLSEAGVNAFLEAKNKVLKTNESKESKELELVPNNLINENKESVR